MAPRAENTGGLARLTIDERVFDFDGRWIEGGPWERFGLYDHYVVVRDDGAVLKTPAHAGELVPGSTEDLVATLRRYDPAVERPPAPMTLELDPTYACPSKDCGTRCFSAPYRQLAPGAMIPAPLLTGIVKDFAREGGRIVRFDGGGDPLAHPSVRSGEIVELVNDLGMKSTILTAGDLLARTDLKRIGRARCYVRVSLNASTDETRQRFHENRSRVTEILNIVEQFAQYADAPIGATYLLDTMNCDEVFDCARMSRDAGIAHFSVRRVLGPPSLRPSFTQAQLDSIDAQFAKIREIASDQFRVFLPWRAAGEPDLNPANGDFDAARCWQSTFKTIVEPDPIGGGFRSQLCGRYRGSGVGQTMQMPPLFSSVDASGWTERWRQSFNDYEVSREALPRTCVSCIDRGFIMMMDRLVTFLENPSRPFHIFHLGTRTS